jgi:catechol 2,3-dioxygenase-like lactoylglutathione lyase family enzyme
MIKKIDHISIVVSDIAEATEFFTCFGFAVEDEALLEGEWISSIVGLDNVRAKYVRLSLPGAATYLELMEYYSPPSRRDPEMSKANQIGFRHIAFEVENIDEIVENMHAQGIEFLSPIQRYEETGKRLVYFPGPDGIILELAQFRND